MDQETNCASDSEQPRCFCCFRSESDGAVLNAFPGLWGSITYECANHYACSIAERDLSEYLSR